VFIEETENSLLEDDLEKEVATSNCERFVVLIHSCSAWLFLKAAHR
jgi:hypothetical protein